MTKRHPQADSPGCISRDRWLREVLAGGIDSECKIVYLPGEARKLLDKYPTNSAPFRTN